MANMKQAKKRMRQTTKKNEVNAVKRSRLRGFIKSVETAITNGNKEEIATTFKTAMSELHRGVTKGIVKKTTASRKISRLSARIKALGAK